MCRSKYVVLISNDTCTKKLSTVFTHFKEKITKLKPSLPNDFLKLMSMDVYVTQLVYANSKEAKSNISVNSEIETIDWATDLREGSSMIPVQHFQTSSDIAQALHKISEIVPLIGSYDMTVLCQGPLFENNPEDHYELFSALLRLNNWCFSDILCIDNETQLNLSPNWGKVIRIDNNSNFGEPCLWKGNVILKSDIWYIKFKLCFDDEEISYKTSQPLDIDVPDLNMEYCVSQDLELLQACDITTVPSYLLYPMKLKLKPFHGNMMEGNPFVEYMKKNPNVGVVGRINFYPAENADKFPQLKLVDWIGALMTDTYKKCLCKEFKHPEDSLFHNILITSGIDSGDEVLSCYIFRNPMNINSAFLDQFLQPDPVIPSKDMEVIPDLIDKLPKYIPFFSGLEESFEEEIKNQEQCENPTLNQKVLRECKIRFRQCLSIENGKVGLNSKASIKNSQSGVDPCDWPERRFLACQVQTEDNKKSTTTCKSNVSLDVGKLFDEQGYAKKTSSSKDSAPKDNTPCINKVHFENVVNMKWPEVKQYRYHDIYYHDNTTEQIESTGERLKIKFIDEETSSKDFKQKYFDKAKSKTPKKKSNLSSLTSENATRKSPRRTNQNLTPSRVSSRKKTPTKICLLNAKSSPVKKSRPLKVQIQPKATTKSKLTKVQKDTKDFDEMSTKKLREAVVSAFESRGFKMNDPMFKACGRRLFNICKEYVPDFIGKPGLLKELKKVAEGHIDQVIEFEKRRNSKKN